LVLTKRGEILEQVLGVGGGGEEIVMIHSIIKEEKGRLLGDYIQANFE